MRSIFVILIVQAALILVLWILLIRGWRTVTWDDLLESFRRWSTKDDV